MWIIDGIPREHSLLFFVQLIKQSSKLFHLCLWSSTSIFCLLQFVFLLPRSFPAQIILGTLVQSAERNLILVHINWLWFVHTFQITHFCLWVLGKISNVFKSTGSSPREVTSRWCKSPSQGVWSIQVMWLKATPLIFNKTMKHLKANRVYSLVPFWYHTVVFSHSRIWLL